MGGKGEVIEATSWSLYVGHELQCKAADKLCRTRITKLPHSHTEDGMEAIEDGKGHEGGGFARSVVPERTIVKGDATITSTGSMATADNRFAGSVKTGAGVSWIVSWSRGVQCVTIVPIG